MATVLVTGGTGTLGRAVVAELAARDQTVRILSRRPAACTGAQSAVDQVTGDLHSGAGPSGAGLSEAVRDAEVIVHCATDVRRPRRDVQGTLNLMAAARAAGARHLVCVSIVVVDLVPVPYYRVKLEVERQVAASGLPWTVLRATQLHELVATALRVLTLPPVVLLPTRTHYQPIDVRELAPRLVDLALSPAVGRAADVGGPAVRPAGDLAQAYLRAVGRRRRIMSLPMPGAIARGYRQGAHLAPAGAVVGRTFEQHLAERLAQR